MNVNVECIKEFVVLLLIGSIMENEFFKQGFLKGQKGFIWFGFNDCLIESMYMLVEGLQICFMDWVNGQFIGKNENCIGFNKDVKYGMMVDYLCIIFSMYVCKKFLDGKWK